MGTADLYYNAELALWKQRNTRLQVHAWLYSATGTYASTLDDELRVAVRGCRGWTTHDSGELDLTNSVILKRTVKCMHTTATQTYSYSYYTMLFPGEGLTTIPDAAVNNSLPNPRCDSKKYFGSVHRCVFATFKPTFTMSESQSGAPKTAEHIRIAQQQLRDHWGLRDQGTALSRFRWTKGSKNPNRTRACRGFVKQNANDSCDEYPFASTQQGMYQHNDRSRISVGHVPLLDNKRGGALLSGFFEDQHILTGDRFWVKINP